MAGFRLPPRAGYTDLGWLVDEVGPQSWSGCGVASDRDLGTVWLALTQPGGPVLVQVLVRPASRRRRAMVR